MLHVSKVELSLRYVKNCSLNSLITVPYVAGVEWAAQVNRDFLHVGWPHQVLPGLVLWVTEAAIPRLPGQLLGGSRTGRVVISNCQRGTTGRRPVWAAIGSNV